MVNVYDDRVELFIGDLKDEAREAVLEMLGLEKPEDGNYDVVPFDIVERPVDDPR